MDKNSLIKFLVKEITQEIKKEIRTIIKEEFSSLSKNNTNIVVNQDKINEDKYTKNDKITKPYISLDSLLNYTKPFSSSELGYTNENVSFDSSYKEPIVDLDGHVVSPDSAGGDLMSKLLSKNYSPILKKAEKIKVNG